MGSKQRRRRAIARANEQVNASRTPMTTRMEIDSDRRSIGRTKPKLPPKWVNDVISNGHSYIQGDRAPVISQDRDTKKSNRRIRQTREVLEGGRFGQGHPVRESADVLAGTTFQREDDWQKVTTRRA